MCYFAFSLLDTGAVIKFCNFFRDNLLTMTSTLSMDKKILLKKIFLIKKNYLQLGIRKYSSF